MYYVAVGRPSRGRRHRAAAAAAEAATTTTIIMSQSKLFPCVHSACKLIAVYLYMLYISMHACESAARSFRCRCCSSWSPPPIVLGGATIIRRNGVGDRQNVRAAASALYCIGIWIHYRAVSSAESSYIYKDEWPSIHSFHKSDFERWWWI